jgi:UPF0716 family protein affecting phage T7 exclusion
MQQSRAPGHAGKAATGLLQSRSMADIRPILKTLDRDFLFKVILFLLAYSVVPLAEIFLFIYLGTLMGNYLVLVAAAVAGLPGAAISLGQMRRARARLRLKVVTDKGPGREISEFAGIFAGGLLLLTPGFLTDLLGYLLLVPAIRGRLGKALKKRLGVAFPEISSLFRLLAM